MDSHIDVACDFVKAETGMVMTVTASKSAHKHRKHTGKETPPAGGGACVGTKKANHNPKNDYTSQIPFCQICFSQTSTQDSTGPCQIAKKKVDRSLPNLIIM